MSEQITPETLAEWRKVAELAHGGDWSWDKKPYVATACPANFIAILDRIAALEARYKAAEEELSAAHDAREAAGCIMSLAECIRHLNADATRADTLAAENENLRRALIRNIAGRYPAISAALAAAEEAERAEATTALASEGDDDAAFVEKQWRKVLSAWTVIDKERIVALARLAVQTPATPYDLLCRVDVLLHDAINDSSLSEDARRHANEAHKLVHDAVAHLSPDKDIRQQARSEAAADAREGLS